MEERSHYLDEYQSLRGAMNRLLVFIVIIILVSSGVVAVMGARMDWVERVVSSSFSSCTPSFVTDHEGVTHIAYCSGTGLYYGRLEDGDWNTTLIVKSDIYTSFYRWEETSLAVDDEGVCHVAALLALDMDTRALLYSRLCQGLPETRALDYGSLGGMIDLASDVRSGTHLAYSKDDALKYAVCKDEEWEIRTVHRDFATGLDPTDSLAPYAPEVVIEPSGQPSIVFLGDYDVIGLITDLEGDRDETILRPLDLYGESGVESGRLSAWHDSDGALNAVWIERPAVDYSLSVVRHVKVFGDSTVGYQNYTGDSGLTEANFTAWHEVLHDAGGVMHMAVNTGYMLRHLWLDEGVLKAENLAEKDNSTGYSPWRGGVAAAYDADGNMMISMVDNNAVVGYYYDAPSVLDRLLEGFPVIAVSSLLLSVLGVAYVVTRGKAKRNLAMHKGVQSAETLDP